jgi:hypothetical protein
MPAPDALRVLAWLCDQPAPDALLRDTQVMQALALSEEQAHTILARLKADGLIESHRVFTQGLEGYRTAVWGIQPTPQGRALAGPDR